MKTAETYEPIKIIPRLEDVQALAEIQRLKENTEAVMAGVAEWVKLIRAFVFMAEQANYTDRNGHALELNDAFRELKASVSEDG